LYEVLNIAPQARDRCRQAPVSLAEVTTKLFLSQFGATVPNNDELDHGCASARVRVNPWSRDFAHWLRPPDTRCGHLEGRDSPHVYPALHCTGRSVTVLRGSG